MNRIAILVLGIGLAASALEKTAFVPGTEYVYDYQGQAATGLPDSSKTFSGLKIQAKLRIQVKSPGEFILKADQVKVMFFNGELPTAELPVAQLPEELFTPLTGEPQQVMEQWLMKPVVFRYEQGIISDLRAASANEPSWSKNIKRGILSVLQINVNGVQRITAEDNEATQISNRMGSQADSKVYFRAMEQSVYGECEAAYHVRQLPSIFTPHGRKVMNISKVYNHKNCQNAPVYFNSLFKGLKLSENITQAELLSMGTVVNYNISGDRANFLLESAEVLGQQVFTPLNKEKGSAITFTNQALKLVHLMQIQSPIVVPASMTRWRRGLIMNIPEAASQFSSGSSINSGTPQGINRPEAIALINMIVDATGDREAKIPMVIMKLMKVLRGATLQDLQAICAQYITVPETQLNDKQRTIRTILLDVLPTIGSRASIDYIKSLLTGGKLPISDRVAQLFSTVALITKPDMTLVNTVKSICELPVVGGDVQMKRTCWLSWSALARQLVVLKEQQPSAKVDLRSLWQDIKGIWKVQKSEEDQLLALKVIGNIGLVDSIDLIDTVIHEPAMTRMIRVQAVYALRHLAQVIPTRVRTILLPMYTNPEERTELRVACCKIIIDTKPSPAILEMIAQLLLRETNLHVASFAYSHLKAISESTLPSLRKLAADIKMALRIAKPITPGAHYPKYLHLPIYNDRLRFGAALDLSYVPTQKSILPQSGVVRLNTLVLGYDINVFEAGLYTEGLQTLVEKFLGPHGSLRASKSAFDVLKPRVKRSDKESIDSIKTKLNVKPREPESPKGSVYIKLFGSELRFFTLGRDFITDIMKAGVVSIKDIETELRNGKAVNIHKTVILEDGILKVPTMLGLPLTLNLTAAAHVHVRGQVNVTVTPSLFQAKRPGQTPTEAIAGINVTPKVIVNVIATMGIHTPFIRTGALLKVLLHTAAPVSAKYVMDITNSKSQIIVDNYQQEQKVVSIVSEPVCVVKYLPNLQTQSNWVIKEQPIKNAIQPTIEDTIVLGKDTLGQAELHVKYMVPRMAGPIRSGDSNLLTVTGKKAVTITARPPTERANQIIIEMSYKNNSKPVAEKPRGSLLWSLFGEGSEETPSDLPSAPGFKPVTSQVKLTNPTEHQVLVTVKGAQDRYVKTQLLYQVNEQSLIHNWDLQLIRSAIPNYDTKPYKICVNQLLTFPRLPESFTSPIALAQAKIETQTKIMHGEECHEEKKMEIKVASTKSSEQMLIEQESIIRQWPEFAQCSKDSSSQLKYTPACVALMERLSQLRSMEFEVAYKPETIQSWLRNYLHDYLNYVLRFDYLLPQVILENREIATRAANGTLKLKIGVSHVKPWLMKPAPMSPLNTRLEEVELYSLLNVSLVTPSMARNITAQLPFPMSISARSWWPMRAMQYLFNNHLPAICRLNGNKVRTFDKVQYDIPPVACDTLVAADCSPDARFLVTIATTPNSAMKTLKIFIERQRLRIVPSGNSMRVEVNGVTKQISPEPLIIRQVPSDTSSPIILKIFLDGSFVKVHAPLSLVDVHFTGLEAIVNTSPFYFGKTCGLCGDFNGEQTNEFKTPTKSVLQKPAHMAVSYLIPGPQCDAEAIKAQYGYVTLYSPIGCSRVYKNLIIDRHINDEDKKCFSIGGVQQCVGQCSQPILSGKRLVRFHCIRADEEATRNLVAEVSTSAIPLKKLETMGVDTQVEVDRVSSCGPTF
ncbi:vitellogenin-like [Lineus longissimus]|uniref:vitellogenin-like n=1 Tax=Lineus longissimus TaxID=88925 RepID=UPI002B4EC5BD